MDLLQTKALGIEVFNVHFELHRDRCIGVGNCVSIAPQSFDQDDDGTVVLLTELADMNSVRAAAQECPSKAIQLNE